MSSDDSRYAEKIIHRVKEAYQLSTDAELAEFLGVGRSTPSNWKSRNSLDYDLLFTKCKDLNFNWLIDGQGPPRRHDLKTTTIREAPADYEALTRTVDVPIYDAALSAGPGAEPSDRIVGYGTFLERWLREVAGIDPARAFLAEVRGYSMVKLFHDRDLVLGQRVEAFERRGIYAVEWGGDVLVKHVEREGHTVRLVSENRAFAPIEVGPDRAADLRVIGEVRRKVTRPY